MNMICPLDQTTLVIADKQGIEIDYCPQCRGVWLDRGELDKLVERQSSFSNEGSSSYADRDRNERREYRDEHDRRGYDNEHHRDDSRKKHKKEGFLGELFDFG